MIITVRFFAYFRELFENKTKEIEIEKGTTVMAILELLCDSDKQRDAIIADGRIKDQTIIMINGEHISSLSGIDAELEDGDTVSIFPLLGGG
jgi:molybdopterin synthase sulfur carrier subunit